MRRPPGARARRAACDARVAVRYAPYDQPWLLRAAFRRFRPALLIVIETEIWPNLLHECARARIPVLFASARISERSARRWARFPALLQPAFATAVTVAAQTGADARRFEALGVPPARVQVCGNLKFDRGVAASVVAQGRALRARFAAARPLWVAGSTHSGEELAALAAHAALRVARGDALLVLAPRHRPRFDEVARLLDASGERWARFSAVGALSMADAQQTAGLSVLLLDTLGELESFYAAADLAFVGGSLVPVGGHNLLEPAALGVATLTGPHQHNAPEIARLLLEHQAVQIVGNDAELSAAVVRLIGDAPERARLAEAARTTVAGNRGALERVLALISASVAAAPRPAARRHNRWRRRSHASRREARYRKQARLWCRGRSSRPVPCSTRGPAAAVPPASC